MKLSQCTMGILVESSEGHIGHVVGLTQSYNHPGVENTAGEVIPVIKWSYKELPSSVHHKNLKIYKD